LVVYNVHFLLLAAICLMYLKEKYQLYNIYPLTPWYSLPPIRLSQVRNSIVVILPEAGCTSTSQIPVQLPGMDSGWGMVGCPLL
jgi:hypothetical protein